MRSAAHPYRSLFVGTLRQDSFLQTGGTAGAADFDSPMCRDGAGRLTLRGGGLAGSMIAMLRRLNGGEVRPEISGSESGALESVWTVFNAHPIGNPKTETRQNVTIYAKTGAALDGGLFDAETTPPGTCWQFILEVDTARDPKAAEDARLVLSQWAAGNCLFGSSVARGWGWLTLEDAFEYKLDVSEATKWPNSTKTADYPAYIKISFRNRDPVMAADRLPPGWREYTIRVAAGERDDGYGIDSLAIGGHASETLSANYGDLRHATRLDSLWNGESFDPDLGIATVPGQAGRDPYLAGSAVHGTLAHACLRLVGGTSSDQSAFSNLFGRGERSGRVLVRDGLATEPETIRLGFLKSHAEDEFRSGVFGSSLHDRLCVLQGSFEARAILEDADSEARALFERALALAAAGQIGLGGQQWRGHGWPAWAFEVAGEQHGG